MNAVACDVVVVGSGASAVHAAWPLVHSGLRVAMVDVGTRDEQYEAMLPRLDYLTMRRTDPNQHRYLLGDAFEGIPFGAVRVGAQLTPPRQFITQRTEDWAPHKGADFSPMQSFALGGLAAGWGASTMPFTDEDMRGWPITRDDLQPHYNSVAERIGICGNNDDDLQPFTGSVEPMMPPPRMDTNARSIYSRYRRRRADFNRAGLYMGYPRLAMATQQFKDRGPLQYTDMEFWSDHERSVYRPRFTVDELLRCENFSYHAGLLAERFTNLNGTRSVYCRHVDSREESRFDCRALVLGAGTLGTARIVLRSLGLYGRAVPLVCNPYTYFPCLNTGLIGTPVRDRRHSLTQLTMIYDPDGTGSRVLQPQLYSYRSLLLFKLLKESPLPFRQSIRIMRLLQEYFVIVGVFHEDRPAKSKSMKLVQDGGRDVLELQYVLEAETERRQQDAEKRLLRLLKKTGCRPIRAIRPGHGSSIHYAGSFPMSNEGGNLTTTVAGELRAAEGVFLVDGSTLPHLPAKGSTSNTESLTSFT